MTKLVFAMCVAMWILTGALMGQSGPAGSIEGTVTDSSNRAIAGAFVTALRQGLPPMSQTAKSGPGGAFQIQGLPAGTYSMCVQLPGDGYLNPCHWTAAVSAATPSTLSDVTLAPGQRSTGNSLKMQTGSVLKVRVEDPGKLMDQKTPDGHDPHLTMGVWGPHGLFYPAHVTGKDNTGADFQLTVPRDTALTFHISSKSFALADGAGAALPGSVSQEAFQHATGDPNPKSFKFHITGKLP